MSEDSNPFGNVIHSYTRKEAIKDGVLIDITTIAKEAGFKYPVVITSRLHSDINDAVEKGGKDYNGVVWDILSMLFHQIKKSTGNTRSVDFKVLIWNKFVAKDKLTSLTSLCHPGDDMEPVITISYPNED